MRMGSQLSRTSQGLLEQTFLHEAQQITLLPGWRAYVKAWETGINDAGDAWA